MNNNIVIAIDGASASGKSTNARIVARALGFIHVDTGAMFRTLAWYCLTKNVDVHDRQAVRQLGGPGRTLQLAQQREQPRSGRLREHIIGVRQTRQRVLHTDRHQRGDPL